MDSKDGKYDDDDEEDYSLSERKISESKYQDDGKNDSDVPKVDVISVEIDPIVSKLTDPFDLKIVFTLDRDAVAALWQIKLLVDSADKRIFTRETGVEDYPDGESEMIFSAESIDVTGIPRSTLANAGLLMACLMVDGEEVASVNMVVNVKLKGDQLIKEILNPLE